MYLVLKVSTHLVNIGTKFFLCNFQIGNELTKDIFVLKIIWFLSMVDKLQNVKKSFFGG